jgi:hypothetical protein
LQEISGFPSSPIFCIVIANEDNQIENPDIPSPNPVRGSKAKGTGTIHSTIKKRKALWQF